MSCYYTNVADCLKPVPPSTRSLQFKQNIYPAFVKHSMILIRCVIMQFHITLDSISSCISHNNETEKHGQGK